MQISTDGEKDYSFGFRDTTAQQTSSEQRQTTSNEGERQSGAGAQPRSARARQRDLVAGLAGVRRAAQRLAQGEGAVPRERALRSRARRCRRTSTRCRARRTCRSRSCSYSARREGHHAGERRSAGRTSASSTSTGPRELEKLRIVRRDRLQRNLELVEVDLGDGRGEDAAHRVGGEREPRAQNVRYTKARRRHHLVVGAQRLGPLLPVRQRRQVQAPAHVRRVARRTRSRRSTPCKASCTSRAWVAKTGENPYLPPHLSRERRRHRASRCSTPATTTTTRTLSPTKRYIVDNYSRVDALPKAVVRDAIGRGRDGPRGAWTSRASRRWAGSRRSASS